MKELVFRWLDIISCGTNKKAVKKLLTPKWISYTFYIGIEYSKQLLKQWKNETNYKETT